MCSPSNVVYLAHESPHTHSHLLQGDHCIHAVPNLLLTPKQKLCLAGYLAKPYSAKPEFAVQESAKPYSAKLYSAKPYSTKPTSGIC